jgi:hypothetical protein
MEEPWESLNGGETMNTHKRTARTVGALFIIGTIAGILSVVTAVPILDDPDYLTEVSANENQVIVGALCVLTMGFALAMVPVVMYPISRKFNETLALGYVVFRGALETMLYIAIVISWLLLITLSQAYVEAGAPDASHFQTLGTLLLELPDYWINYINTLVWALGALMFYYLLYQSKLIPRWLSGWGLVGTILIIAAGLLGLFGSSTDLLEFPLAVQEMVMALWLIVKGFDASVVAAVSAETA